jgi:hypothetical protein
MVVVISLTVYTALARNGLVRRCGASEPCRSGAAAALDITYYSIWIGRTDPTRWSTGGQALHRAAGTRRVGPTSAVRPQAPSGLATVAVAAAFMAARRTGGIGASCGTTHTPADRS